MSAPGQFRRILDAKAALTAEEFACFRAGFHRHNAAILRMLGGPQADIDASERLATAAESEAMQIARGGLIPD